MAEKETRNVGLILIIILLLLMCAGMVAFIFFNYNKILTSKDNNIVTVDTDKRVTADKKETPIETNDTIKTRKCIGIYSGIAALSQDFQTGQYEKGTLTIELKSDGTYELKKENMNGDLGNYTIIENALLLKTGSKIAGPGEETTAEYSQFLNISSDCSTISWGYGSYFMDPNFTLTKNN